MKNLFIHWSIYNQMIAKECATLLPVSIMLPYRVFIDFNMKTPYDWYVTE